MPLLPWRFWRGRVPKKAGACTEKGGGDDGGKGGGPTKTVTVGTQTGTILANQAGQSATFSVETENIAAGDYTPTIMNCPTGITAQTVTIDADGNGTLTLNGDVSTVAGVYSALRLRLDGTLSEENFTLTIIGKSVSVGAQDGTLVGGVAGTITFPVTTVNIAAGDYPATLAGNPEGISVQGEVSIDAQGAGTLTLAGNTSIVQGTTSTVRITIDETQSSPFTITVSPPPSITVAAQSSTIVAGIAKANVIFTLTCVDIPNGTLNASNIVGTIPEWVTLGTFMISSVMKVLTISVSDQCVAGSYPLQVKVGDVISNTFNIVVKDPASLTISIGNQSGTLTPGGAQMVTFNANAPDITGFQVADGASLYSKCSFNNLPAGVSFAGGMGTMFGFRAGGTAAPGVYDNVELVWTDGALVVKGTFTITIS